MCSTAPAPRSRRQPNRSPEQQLHSPPKLPPEGSRDRANTYTTPMGLALVDSAVQRGPVATPLASRQPSGLIGNTDPTPAAAIRLNLRAATLVGSSAKASSVRAATISLM